MLQATHSGNPRLVHVVVDGLFHDQARDPLLGELLELPGVMSLSDSLEITTDSHPEPNSSHANPVTLPLACPKSSDVDLDSAGAAVHEGGRVDQLRINSPAHFIS